MQVSNLKEEDERSPETYEFVIRFQSRSLSLPLFWGLRLYAAARFEFGWSKRDSSCNGSKGLEIYDFVIGFDSKTLHFPIPRLRLDTWRKRASRCSDLKPSPTR